MDPSKEPREPFSKNMRRQEPETRRLLQYFEGAQFKAHVDSGWACQALQGVRV